VIGRTYIKEVKDRILNHSHIKHSWKYIYNWVWRYSFFA
jgi:hypothetical protein